jgi:hypothetical protein
LFSSKNLLPSTIDEKDYVKISKYIQVKLKEKQPEPYHVVVLSDTFFVTQEHLKKVYDEHFDNKINFKVNDSIRNPAILSKLKQLSTSNTSTSNSKGKAKTSQASHQEILGELVFIDEVNLEKELKTLFDNISDDFIKALIDFMLKYFIFLNL